MSSAQIAPLTVEDYRMLPEGGPRYQLIEGDLYMAPAPNRFHQDISGYLQALLYQYVAKHRLGKVYAAPFDVYFNEINVHQPDIVFVSKRNKILTDGGAEGAPDFIVEILSPKTAYLDQKSKKRVFARCGVKELWIIDPIAQVVHVYYLRQDREKPVATYSERDTFTSPHFPGLKFKAAKIFQR